MNDITYTRKPRIAIVDSGIDKSHPIFDNSIVDCIDMTGLDQPEDRQGHGTSVAGIISKNVKQAIIIVIKIICDQHKANIDSLVKALEYIYSNISCDIVHLSIGSRYSSNELFNICAKLANRGVIIVSAFANSGCISFPAAYDFVIGVDSSENCLKTYDYIYVKNDCVNILAKGGNHRVPSLNGKYKIVQGTSYSAAYVTSIIAEFLISGVSKSVIHRELEAKAKEIIDYASPRENHIEPCFKIKRAAVFPSNKEIDVLLRNSDMLDYNIIHVYDMKSYTHPTGVRVESISDLASDIDTFIIGHCDRLEAIYGYNIKGHILEFCLCNSINVYMLDDSQFDEYIYQFETKRLKIRTPRMRTIPPTCSFGKLYSIAAPVLLIMGTGRKQGKYTLQIILKRKLITEGYKVRHLSSEPSGELFGANAVIPYGYMANDRLDYDSVSVINMHMHLLDDDNPDIILAGTQSNTIPLLNNNIRQIPIETLCFVFGVQPDAVILCVSLDDDLQYVKSTVATIENLYNCKVIAVSVYPAKYKNEWMRQNNHMSIESEVDEFKELIFNNIGVRAYSLFDESDKIYEASINYFASEE